MNLSKTSQLLKAKVPRHVAIIMDGNGRWAKSRLRPRIWGHQQGVTSVRETVKACGELGVAYLTLYAFSDENWSRPAAEVRGLLQLLDSFVAKEGQNLDDQGVRLRVIGDVARIPERTRESLSMLCNRLQNNNRLHLTLALSYGSRGEIVRACSKLAHQVEQGKLRAEDIRIEHVAQYLDTTDLPDPDLLIRTSGERRISNFLLWQLAYAELWFTDVHWPDFRRAHLQAALDDYASRRRRFGLTDEQIQALT
ncbi:MAG: isoprenyl transferase [Zetaproteobacteria bacterium]|nr:isoprenyl transferase [Zetaproteobacteria bacterium]